MTYNDDPLYERPEYTLEDAIQKLPLDQGVGIVPPEVVYGLSDLEYDQLVPLRPVWESLSSDRRAVIMERLNEVSEADYMLDYSTFALLGYDDPSAVVRAAAVEVGWADESLATMNRLVELVEVDPSVDVRAAAVIALGKFVYMGEVEDISPTDIAPVSALLLNIVKDQGEPLQVRRRALESIANLSHNEVAPLIESAYQHDDLLMRISAITAMGNSMDERWESYILEELDSDYPEMTYEAVRAAGNVLLGSAVEKLRQLAFSDDEQLQEVVIWSLGEIGGDDAIAILQELEAFAEENNDDELLDAIDDALATARMLEDMQLEFGLLGLDEDDEFTEDDYEDRLN